MKICHTSTLVKNLFCEFEDIHQDPEFHENPMLPRAVDSNFYSADSLSLKLNQLVWSDFHETLEERSTCECLQIQIMDFRYLLSK